LIVAHAASDAPMPDGSTQISAGDLTLTRDWVNNFSLTLALST